MSSADGQVRASQLLTTYGPGALIDLPHASGIVGGLDFWPRSDEQEIVEPRLIRKLAALTGVAVPRLYAPPSAPDTPYRKAPGVRVWRFPEWLVVQEDTEGDTQGRLRSRRLVHRRSLDERGRFDGKATVAIRFVRACGRGHIDDLEWSRFVHGPEQSCPGQLWLDERGTSGDLAELSVRCEACGRSRRLSDASEIESNALGFCRGRRPWLGAHSSEECSERSRLLVRTASNAYFAQVLSALALPDHGGELERTVRELWGDLQIVQSVEDIRFLKRKPMVAERLEPFDEDKVMTTIEAIKAGGCVFEPPVKQAELEAILAAPEGYGEDAPLDPDFHVRRLPDHAWRHGSDLDAIESVYQLHRLREVMVLVGFSRFEAIMPDIDGEYDPDLQRASIALEPAWFPAVENRGEGIFVRLRATAVREWLGREGAQRRIDALEEGHRRCGAGPQGRPAFPGRPLHPAAHPLASAHPGPGHACRLCGKLDPRARLR